MGRERFPMAYMSVGNNGNHWNGSGFPYMLQWLWVDRMCDGLIVEEVMTTAYRLNSLKENEA
jgi:hypothetical protein